MIRLVNKLGLVWVMIALQRDDWIMVSIGCLMYFSQGLTNKKDKD